MKYLFITHRGCISNLNISNCKLPITKFPLVLKNNSAYLKAKKCTPHPLKVFKFVFSPRLCLYHDITLFSGYRIISSLGHICARKYHCPPLFDHIKEENNFHLIEEKNLLPPLRKCKLHCF